MAGRLLNLRSWMVGLHLQAGPGSRYWSVSYTHLDVYKRQVLHLKTGVNYIENNKMLVSGEFVDKPEFAKYEKYVIPEDEAYAANCIWMNGKVIVPDHFPKVAQIVRDAGYEVILVDTSEYRKIDGGLSCLSLRFTAQK